MTRYVPWTERDRVTRDEFDDFYRAHFKRAARLAYLLTGSEVLAPEMAQEALLAVHRGWGTIAAPEAYLRVAIVNQARSAQRRSAVERRHARRATRHPVGPSTPVIDETWHCLRRLAPDQRAVVVLRFYEDRPLAEIAELLDKPLGTVKSLLHRALAKLEEALRDEP